MQLTSSPRAPAPPSIVSGCILTMNPEMPVAQAMGIAHGRIVCMGSAAYVKKFMGAGVARHDYRKGVVVPGFIDAHNHMLWTGIQQKLVDLAGCRSIAEMQQRLRAYRQAHPEREWVVSGEGWHVEHLAEKRYPTRQELDAAVPDRPVYLPRGGHSASVNSLALKLAGIDRHTPEPAGGKIHRDENGEPNGLLMELQAFNLVAQFVPPVSRQLRCEALRDIQRAYHAAGITGVIEPGLMSGDMGVYQELWRAGELTVRTVAMPQAQVDQDPDALMHSLESWSGRTGLGDEWLKLGAIKVYLDGGASFGTALMREPYPDERCQCGIQVTHTSVFRRIAEFCAREGWSLGVHTVGGKAIDLALEVFEDVHRRYPVDALRFSLIHAYLWPSQRNIETVRRLKMGIATQAPMQYQFAPLLARRFGLNLMGKATPLKAWLDAGVTVGGSSDSPIANYRPLQGIWHAVTRYVDELDTVLGSDEAITVDQALAMYTRGSAWMAFSEQQRGMLRPGFLADWVALDQDPYAIDPMALRDIKVQTTAVGGQVVYQL
jgi:predicted amidohydrolase YtcJ